MVPSALDPDGIADGQSSAVVQVPLSGALTAGFVVDGIADGNSSAGSTVALDGVLAGGGFYSDSTGIPRHISILDVGGDVQTTATYTVTGTDSNGSPLTESIAGPGSFGFVATTSRFSTISSIAIASPVAGSTVDIGVNGVFIASDSLAHQIDIIDTGADIQTGATYTIVGTDIDGLALSEDIAGPGSGATIETTGYFKTITCIAIASPVAGSTIDVGIVDEVSAQSVPLNLLSQSGATVHVDVTGTIDFTVRERFDDIQLSSTAVQTNRWIAVTALATKTADTTGVLTAGASACQIIVNSYTAGAELQVYITQPPMGS